jgi:hypothetical protein
MSNNRTEFRVWDTATKRMTYAHSPAWLHYGINLRGDVINMRSGVGGGELILQQFTGEYDNTFNKIFEGDIVQYKITSQCGEDVTNHTDVVKRRGNSFDPLVGSSEYCEEDCFYERIYSNFLVLGNIYENPELNLK